MKEMDNNKKELKESRLMEVTGGMAKPANKEKNSEPVPKFDYKTVTCTLCKKEFKVPIFPNEEKLSPMSVAWRALHPEEYEKLEKCTIHLCPECSKKYCSHIRRFRW